MEGIWNDHAVSGVSVIVDENSHGYYLFMKINVLADCNDDNTNNNDDDICFNLEWSFPRDYPFQAPKVDFHSPDTLGGFENW